MALPQQTTERTTERAAPTPVEEIPARQTIVNGWTVWAALAVVIVAVGFLVSQVFAGATVDSFDRNELNRQLALDADPPAGDGSFEYAEHIRFGRLAPDGWNDTSADTAELARMMRLAPEPGDGSFDVAEYERMQRLAP